MVKKLQKMAEKKAEAGLLDSGLAGTIKESAQQIWLAGLGAFSKAQEEGGRLFETLVKEGTSLQRKTQSAAGDKLGDMAGRMTSMAGDVGARAGQHWDKLESIFEDRTAKAMSKLGVPMKKDVDALAAKVPGGGAKAGKTAARKRAPAKTAVKRAPRKTAA